MHLCYKVSYGSGAIKYLMVMVYPSTQKNERQNVINDLSVEILMPNALVNNMWI